MIVLRYQQIQGARQNMQHRPKAEREVTSTINPVKVQNDSPASYENIFTGKKLIGWILKSFTLEQKDKGINKCSVCFGAQREL